ncbi:MAG: sensor histidine kinase [Lachnospiraceae bacterium]|nr:sensor histidine kinase [Lachnospiraceae bacterium]
MKHKITGKLREYFNCLKLNQKLKLLFLFCVLIPMMITDVIILANVYKSVAYDVETEMEQTARSVEYVLQNHMEYPANIAHNLYKSRVIEDFLNEQYKSPYDYYDAYYRLESGLMFDAALGIEGARVSIFADNPTILNGSGFYRMESFEDEDWFKALYSGEENRQLYYEYSTGMDSDAMNKRRILMLVKMDMAAFNGCKKALRVDLDFSDFEDELKELEIDDRVLVCDGDTLLFTNRESTGELEPFEIVRHLENASYRKEIKLYGKDLTIYIVSKENEARAFLMRNGGIFVLLMALNIIVLLIMMFILDKTMVTRIKYLENSFGIMDEDKMRLIESIGGDDEISALIRSYNRMADRMNELVTTVYKGKLKEQEMDLAKQNAELLALHSQINPHFLFNALESIRMHSLLKDEKETAEMVGRLAVMERTYVNWGDDMVPVSKEMDFVEAFLSLQKYRFGDRLNYQLDVAEDCYEYQIPKLTIVTFVENAIEHGVETKSAPGWIFVRIKKADGALNIEIEDTGVGMNIVVIKDITEKAKTATIESMRGKSHVGIMNAFLRLKLLTGDQAEFAIESERGVGTVIRLIIPLEERIESTDR